MSRNRTIVLIGVLLAVVALPAAAVPAMAHPGVPTAPASPESGAATPPAAAEASENPRASDSPGLIPWIAAGVLLVAGLFLRRRVMDRTIRKVERRRQRAASTRGAL